MLPQVSLRKLGKLRRPGRSGDPTGQCDYPEKYLLCLLPLYLVPLYFERILSDSGAEE